MNRNFVWRLEEIDTLNPNSDPDDGGFGGQPKFYRGGYNCRHRWFKILYKNTGAIRNKSSIGTNKIKDEGGRSSDLQTDWNQPSLVTSKTLGNPSPSTIRNLGLSKEKFEKVSIDYDDTLSTDRGKELAKKLIEEGNDVHVVTRRQDDAMETVKNTAKELGIPLDKVHNTNGELKWKTLIRLGIKKHYDNSDEEIEGIKKNAPEVEGIKFGYDVGGLPAYVDQIPTGKTKNNFQSYSDYPQAVKDNAKSVLKWVEENGWGSCGTEVGKIRANQLADGKPITEETIMRMYSYLSRHKVDLQSSKSYEDGCGLLMFNSWGGIEALGWAERKLRKLQAEKMSRQNFQVDSEEKRIILGPCMVPDQEIFRKDKDGNPYYVFFSKDTIFQIQEKFMRRKYLDNADTEHNGKAEQDVYVIESWIKEDENDKSTKYGFGDLPIGTWFVSMKVRNDEVWEKIKDGSLAGYSVSGFFEEVEQFSNEYMFLKQLEKLLKTIKE